MRLRQIPVPVRIALVLLVYFALLLLIALAPARGAHAQRTPIQIRRATTATMPALLDGQPAYATDTNVLWIGWGGVNKQIGGRILIASGAPSAIVGNVGDTYINATTGDVFQKINAGWNLAANIKGSTGPQGLQGLQGLQGIPGLAGSPGADGISPTLSMGTVTTLYASAVPTATMGGTASARTLNLALPAAGFTYIGSVPAIALAEVNTSKPVTVAFPAAFPDTNYIFFVQFVNASGLVNTVTWTSATKTTTGLTIYVKSTVALLAGSTDIWLFVSHRNM